MPTADPGRALTAGEVERLWKTDRRSLMIVNECFYRLVCQYHAVREEIGGVQDEPLCSDPVPTEHELRDAVPNMRKGKPIRPVLPAPPIPKHQKRLE